VPEDDTLVLTHSGILSLQDAQEQAQVVLSLMKETRATRFLLDYSETTTQVADEDVPSLPEYCFELGAPLQSKVALVVPRSQFRVDSFELFASVARERGFTIELFSTRLSAQEWLRKGAPET